MMDSLQATGNDRTILELTETAGRAMRRWIGTRFDKVAGVPVQNHILDYLDSVGVDPAADPLQTIMTLDSVLLSGEYWTTSDDKHFRDKYWERHLKETERLGDYWHDSETHAIL